MANTKSAQKCARQSLVKREKNKTRKSAIKTAIKKVLDSIERGDEKSIIQTFFKDAESKLARAKGKRLYHSNTVSRKISRLAKKIAAIA
jgi:small subunit ribosomal protein S20